MEKANRSREGTLVDMSWDIKDIVSLVELNVLSIKTAQEMLGIDSKKEGEKIELEEETSANLPYQENPTLMNTQSEIENE